MIKNNNVKRRIAQEKNLEKRLRKIIAKMGGVALKFSSFYSTGWPDRFIFMPWGCVYLAEIKTEGKILSKKQEARVKKARSMGFKVFIIDSEISYRKSVNQLQNDFEIYG